VRGLDTRSPYSSLARHSFWMRASRTCELPHLGPLDDQDLVNWMASLDRIDVATTVTTPSHNVGTTVTTPSHNVERAIRTCELPHLGPLDDQDLVNWMASLDPIDVGTTATTPPHIVERACVLPVQLVEKKLRPKYIRDALTHWMRNFQEPYVNIADKKFIATALNIPVAQVSNFCNNHRKRYFKVDNIMTSYVKCRMLYGQALAR
jgi:hypothetical protein